MPNQSARRNMASPRRIWRDILLAVTLLWIGLANLPTAVRLYEEHQGTVSALLLIVSECLLSGERNLGYCRNPCGSDAKARTA